MRIVSLQARDIRFPTSRSLDGSDAMHESPDYSCAYVVLRTDSPAGLEGCGLTFTNGRGTEIVVAAVRALEHLVVGRTLEEITSDMSGFWRSLASEGQLRWLGPEKGVIHLATGALVNAVWDLWAKREGKPLYRLLADLEPEQLVSAIDFRYIEDALAPQEALELLQSMRIGREARLSDDARVGLPGVHHLGRLARLRRRQDRRAGARGRAGGIHPREDEGRSGYRLRRGARRADPLRARARRRADDGRQSVLGRR
jgi:L-fuconate dehydratase